MICYKPLILVCFLQLFSYFVHGKYLLVETEDDQVEDNDYSNDDTCSFDSSCNNGFCPPCQIQKYNRNHKACGPCIKLAIQCPPCNGTSIPRRKTKIIRRKWSSSSSKRSSKRTWRKVTSSKKFSRNSNGGDYQESRCEHGQSCNGHCPRCVYCCPNLYCECNGKIVFSHYGLD